MSISKKHRFEVFKRDGFKCAYCGKSPPAVILEVDHIEPKSKGGVDDINNLITACFDCNRGKSNIPLKRIVPKLSENLEVLKEQEEQLKEYHKFIQKINRRFKKDIEGVSEVYAEQYHDWEFSENFKNISVKKFLELLPKHEVIDSLYTAIAKFPTDKDTVIRYFCGVCWSKIKYDDPPSKIKREWRKLSTEYKRGVGYFKDSDIEEIEHIPLKALVSHMHDAFSDRRGNYWKYFIDEVKRDYSYEGEE